MTQRLSLTLLSQSFSICRFSPQAKIPDNLLSMEYVTISRTNDELSIVCPSMQAPICERISRGWRCLVVNGPLDFEQVGVLSGLAKVLANVNISIFVFSTFDTDYLLVREEQLKNALEALKTSGYSIMQKGDS